MRRALGLGNAAAPRPHTAQSTASHGAVARPQRHFVRDGEVPVTVIHRDESSGTNQLDAARQTIRTLTVAGETAERRLAEAQATIQQLQTQLAHERLARDDATARTEAIRQTLDAVQAELAIEQAARQQAEKRVPEFLRPQPDSDNGPASASPGLVPGSNEPRRRGRPRKLVVELEPVEVPISANPATVDETAQAQGQPLVTSSKRQAAVHAPTPESTKSRRRGRPPTATTMEPDSEYVEWWKPGWREKYRK